MIFEKEHFMRQLSMVVIGLLLLAFSANAQVTFIESAGNLGVTQLDFGIGVAIADINGDGYAEIITTNNSGPDRVYVWNDSTYDDMGGQYGIHDSDQHHSICITDLDKNSLPDIYITGDQYSLHGHMYTNFANNHFTDMAASYNLQVVDEMGSAFFQLTSDSDLSILRGGKLMIRENGTFIDHTIGSGLEDITIVLTPLFFDIDGDYDSDLYIGHNWEHLTGTLFRNNGDSTFTDISTNTDSTGFKMCNSAVIGDIDNDGDFDIYQLSGFNHNIMWLNDGTGYFTDVTEQTQTGYEGYTRAANFADFDNDGDLDLFINRAQDYNMLLLNNGHGVFTDASVNAGVVDDLNGFGSSVGDLNNDGQLDIVTVNCCSTPKQLYINQNQNNSYLRVRLHGQQHNTMALGAVAKLYGIDSLNNQTLIGTRTLQSHTTGCSVDEPIMHFGTGNYQNLALEVHFPSGTVVNRADLIPGQIIDIIEPEFIGINDSQPRLPQSGFIINAYPNPFNSSTIIGIEGGSGASEIAIYDLLGRTVKATTIPVGNSSGKYLWDGTDNQNNHIPSGVYFVRVQNSSYSSEIKVTLLK
jgi:hypothetical protein